MFKKRRYGSCINYVNITQLGPSCKFRIKVFGKTTIPLCELTSGFPFAKGLTNFRLYFIKSEHHMRNFLLGIACFSGSVALAQEGLPSVYHGLGQDENGTYITVNGDRWYERPRTAAS